MPTTLMNTKEREELVAQLRKILNKYINKVITRGLDWPLGRTAMLTNAVDEIADLLSSERTKAIEEGRRLERVQIVGYLLSLGELKHANESTKNQYLSEAQEAHTQNRLRDKLTEIIKEKVATGEYCIDYYPEISPHLEALSPEKDS